MKLLLSAYACEPNRGSEPGVGWNWAVEMAALGHEVWVVTRRNNRTVIDAALQASKSPHTGRLHFVYFDLPWIWLRLKRLPFGTNVYYERWQHGIMPMLRELHAQVQFDAAQHITFGTFRTPCDLWQLGIPWVFGPLGGGDTAPTKLRRSFPPRGKFIDGLRDLVNRRARRNPAVTESLDHCTLLLAKTPQTQACVERPGVRVRCLLEIGIDPSRVERMNDAGSKDYEPLRFLFVGRLLYLKGGHLAIEAFARFCRTGARGSLTLIGSGPERAAWTALAARLGVADRIHWISWMPQDHLMKAYQTMDVLLFPSLRDSSGNVVLESLAKGLPVVCLDVGGPAEIVSPGCAIVVPAASASEAEVVAALGDALLRLDGDRQLLQSLRGGAIERASSMTWQATVGKVWSDEALQSWLPAAGPGDSGVRS